MWEIAASNFKTGNVTEQSTYGMCENIRWQTFWPCYLRLYLAAVSGFRSIEPHQ